MMRLAALVFLVCGVSLLPSGLRETVAQPASSLTSVCGKLRAALDELNPPESELVTIDVVGELTLVQFDGAIAYMGMCSAPDPQVLCVTYSTGNWKAGDTAIVSGGYNRGGPDSIVLDPCLPYTPSEDDLKKARAAKVRKP